MVTDRQTDRRIHESSTVTLAAHARRGLTRKHNNNIDAVGGGGYSALASLGAPQCRGSRLSTARSYLESASNYYVVPPPPYNSMNGLQCSLSLHALLTVDLR